MITHFHRTIPLSAAQGWVPPSGSGVADIYAALDASQKTQQGNPALNTAGGNPGASASAAAWLGAGSFAAELAAYANPAAALAQAPASASAASSESAAAATSTGNATASDPASSTDTAEAAAPESTGGDASAGSDAANPWSLALAGPLFGRSHGITLPPTTGNGLTGGESTNGSTASAQAAQAVKSYQALLRGLR